MADNIDNVKGNSHPVRLMITKMVISTIIRSQHYHALALSLSYYRSQKTSSHTQASKLLVHFIKGRNSFHFIIILHVNF